VTPMPHWPDFSDVYRQHRERIFALVRRMLYQHEDRQEEVVQDIFLAAWHSWDKFQGRAAVGSWLYRIAINVTLQHRMKLSRDVSSAMIDAWLADDYRKQPHEIAEAVEELQEVKGAIQQLVPRQRAILVLASLQGYNHAEIGARLGLKAYEVKSILHRARVRLRKTIRRT